MPSGAKSKTVGDLRRSRYKVLPVREELRKNLITKLQEREELFPGIVGFDETVLPQIENALLAGQDMLLLGERGQAKSRLIRHLVSLLDEEIPVIAGCEINDHPYKPICRGCRDRICQDGDEVAIDWLPRDARYSEKLATPDISIADLIGEVDPIKVAEGRYLSDELTIHYGLIPRTNRGIFSINELPDLAERIQVGMFNLMEERDVQIKGLPDTATAGRVCGGHRQPRGLHQPGEDHHPLEGSLRRPDTHPLSTDHRGRSNHHGAGTLPVSQRKEYKHPSVHAGGHSRDYHPGPPQLRD